MDIDRLQDKERRDILAQMAEMYYNQGRTQSEIADHFGTNRFRVARMIQEAKSSGSLIDATHGRKTLSVIITDSDHVILSYLDLKQIAQRFGTEGEDQ